MGVADGDNFKAQWRRLSLSDRHRIRRAVQYGQAIDDTRLAPMAVGLARKWRASVMLSRPFQYALIGIVGLIAIGAVIAHAFAVAIGVFGGPPIHPTQASGGSLRAG